MITRADVYKAHEEEHLKIVDRIKELQYAIAKTQTIVGEMVESAEAVHGWIPCSKRLPENTVEWKAYITCNEEGIVATTYWAGGWNCLRKPDGEIDREYEIKNIVAWMPLPEPYEGGDAE